MEDKLAMTLDVRLSAPSLGVWVDVHLRTVGQRWVASAELDGLRQLGIGPSARGALSASLAPLGERARSVLLADPALMAASTKLEGSAGGH